MKKYLKGTEIVWMVMALLCVCITTYYFINGDTDNGVFGMIVTLAAGLMYSLRRRFNKYVERMAKKQEELEKNGK